MTRAHGFFRVLVASAMGLSSAACGDSTTDLDSAPTASSVARFVAGSASAALVTPPALGPEEIDGERAEALAKFRLAHIGPANRSLHEEVRGAPIAWSALTPCARTYASSPFQPLPSTLPMPVRRSAASWWIVTFCAGEPQMTIAVNALSRDIRPDGSTFRLPAEMGNHFLPRAVRTTPAETFMISAEQAVEAVATATGARVLPPVTLAKVAGVIPQFARWRVRVANEVPLTRTSTQATLRTDVMYYGHHPTSAEPVLLVPSSAQRPRPVRFRDPGNAAVAVERRLKAGGALDFDVVTPLSTSAPDSAKTSD